MRILYDNFIDDATLSTDAAESGYPVTNVQDPRLSRVWRSTDGDTYVVADLGSVQDVNMLVIAAHTITVNDRSDFLLQANASDSWGAPTYELNLYPYWNPESIVDYMGPDIFIVILPTTQSYRYWRLRINEPSASYHEIGRFALGEYYQMPGFTVPYVHNVATTTKIQKSLSGQVYADLGYQFRQYTFQFPDISLTVRDELKTIFTELDIATPMFVYFEETEIDEDSIYARCSYRSLRFQGKGNVFYGSRLDIEEVF